MFKEKTNHPDYFLLAIVLALSLLGILVSVGISANASQKIFKSTTYYLFHQLIYGFLIGGILGFTAFKLPLSFFKKWSWVFIFGSLVLMGLVFIPGFSAFSGGASRWLKFGIFTFQPSEFLKISFIIYFAALLAKRNPERRNREIGKSILVPSITIMVLIVLLLYLQSDLSTLAIIIFSGFLMYFTSNTPILYNILIVLGGVSIFSIFIVFSPYRLNRVFIFLGRLRDPLKTGYQIKQALIAIGSGGVLGLGLGVSNQAKYLPHPISDSVFALVAEELGLVGSLVLIFLFLAFFWRGIKIAKESNDKFCKFFSVGFISWIVLQAFVNIGSMVKLSPLTGIPLPFISYGGSHVIVELIGVGILLNISKFTKKNGRIKL